MLLQIQGVKMTIGYIRRSDEDQRLIWALGSLVKALATPADTGGVFEVLEYAGRQDDAAPVHIHPQASEAFYILEGKLTILLDQQEVQATAGSFSFIPPGEAHAFRIDSPTATFLQFMAPGGIFAFFEEIGESAPSAAIPPVEDESWDIDALLEAMERHGMQVLGPPLGME